MAVAATAAVDGVRRRPERRKSEEREKRDNANMATEVIHRVFDISGEVLSSLELPAACKHTLGDIWNEAALHLVEDLPDATAHEETIRKLQSLGRLFAKAVDTFKDRLGDANVQQTLKRALNSARVLLAREQAPHASKDEEPDTAESHAGARVASDE